MPKLPSLDSAAKIASVVGVVVAILIAVNTFLPSIQTLLQPSPTPAYTTAASDGNLTFKSNYGFSITYPTVLSNYKEQNGSLNPKIKVFLNSSEHRDMVLIETYDVDKGQNLTLRDVATDSLNTVKSLEDFKLISQGANSTLDSKPAYRIVYTTNEHTFSNLEGTREIDWRLGLYNGRVYSVGYNAVPNDYYQYLPLAQQIIDSFRYT